MHYLLAFPRQEWFRERTSILSLYYIASLLSNHNDPVKLDFLQNKVKSLIYKTVYVTVVQNHWMQAEGNCMCKMDIKK